MNGAPFTNLRPMTDVEVCDYIEREKLDEGDRQ